MNLAIFGKNPGKCGKKTLFKIANDGATYNVSRDCAVLMVCEK